ncbi:MAG: V-type ATP synthase subunit E family protein [Euryarchaeota archaeon]
MGLKELEERILEEAKREAEEIVKEAEEEAEKILEKAKREAEERRREILDRARREAETRKRREIAQARLEARQLKLQAKEECIEEALERARRRIRELSEEGSRRYLEFLERAAVEAARAISTDKVILRVNERDREAMEELLPDVRVEVDKEVELGDPVDILGGVIAESEDGSEVFDNSVEARMRRMRSELVRRVSDTLFGG